MSEIYKVNTVDEATSKRITSLRFILSILVVFIHNTYSSSGILEDIEKGIKSVDFVFKPNLFSEYVKFFLSGGFGSCVVPLFFMFSGFLQFKKKNSYAILIKKRSKSLVLPYFLWIAIQIIMISLSKIVITRINPSLLVQPETVPVFFSWSPLQWFAAFFGDYFNAGISGFMHPFVGQFYFVRDLFILILLSPILTKFAKKAPIEMILFSLSIYCCFSQGVIISKPALLFYMLGFYWADNDFDLFAFADKCKWIILLPLYFFFAILSKNSHFQFLYIKETISVFLMFSAMLLLLKFSKILIENEKIFKVTEYFSSYAFFLFAMHLPFVMISLQTVWVKFFPMKNAFYCLFEYFGVAILNIIICTGFGIFLKKFCPKLFTILNGGR